MENQLGSFSLTTDNLSFTDSSHVLKTVIKNLSLKSTSYDVSIPDSDHFKLLSHRMFGLAPGMSKILQIKHVPGEHCKIQEKQIRKMKVTNSYKKSHIIYCKCPCFLIKQPQKLIEFPSNLDVGQFDQEKVMIVPVSNISQKNMKLSFRNFQQLGIIINFPVKERILLEGESLDMQMKIKISEYKQFCETIFFQVIQESQEYEESLKFQIQVSGQSVNRVLAVKGQNNEALTDLKHEMLNGTNVSSCFYLQNKYTKPTNFRIQTFINVQNPAEYAKKWKNCSLTVSQPNGLLQPLTQTKIDYTINTHYNEDDENFVIKYSKISLSDDVNSLRIRNSQYARKNLQINVIVHFSPQNKDNKNPQDLFQKSSDDLAATKECSKLIKVKCNIINPCVRYQLTNVDEAINRIAILNQTKLNLPFNFSLHSLYRIKPAKGFLQANKKQFFLLKWNKERQKCKIYLELPQNDILIYDAKELKKKDIIDRPASRRPKSSMKMSIYDTQGSFYKTNQINSSAAFVLKPELLRPLTPLSTQFFTKKIKNVECGTILKEIPKFFHTDKIPIEELDCLIISEDSTNIMNTHTTVNIILQIIDKGFLILAPSQKFFFNEKQLQKGINFKVYGHQYIYRLLCTKEDKKKFKLNPSYMNKENVISSRNQNAYKVLARQLRMHFEESKNEFQVQDVIPIRNNTNQPLHVYCVTVDGQFFQSKQENNHLVIQPNQVGKFRISFFPKNCIRLGMLKKQPPAERRKAEIKNLIDVQKTEGSKIKKQIELMIGKNIEKILCVGELSQKMCETRPSFIAFNDCKYGSAQCTETFLITNVSSTKKIYYMVEYPPEVVVRPKVGIIGEKSTIACTVSFKPFKKIENYKENIRVYIKGSHMELIPLKIDVSDPDIYIREDEIVVQEESIYGGQNQELYAQITLINNNPSQCHVELNFKDTEIFVGYLKNNNLLNEKGLVIQNFLRNSRIQKQLREQDQRQSDEERKTENQEKRRIGKVCYVTVSQQNSLMIPLTFVPKDTSVGLNIAELKKNIATLIGFGPIRAPKRIKYEGKKKILQITPHQQIHDIVLTKNQQIYQINLKNVSSKTIKVKTNLIQQKKENQEPLMICTYKDIHDFLQPQASIDLAMSFIAFDGDKHALTSDYIFNVYLTEKESEEEYSIPYISTKLHVSMPEPFLEISPTILIMPTVSLNSWSRSSFTITNQGHKQIFIKIKKPINIAFQLQYQIVSFQIQANNSKLKNSPNYTKKQISYLQNQLTRLRNCIQVKLNFRSKTKISFNIILEIHDNFSNKYEMMVAGTTTDCPLFQPQTINNNLFQSAKCINNSPDSHNNISSFNSISSSATKNRQKLCPADIQDLLFLNNWLGIIIPELSNQSVFFYVWMTKIQNIIKFLKQFNVDLNEEKKGHKNTMQTFNNLKEILEFLKKNGFQLNSLRVERLQNGDQFEWLNFMWYFFSQKIVCKQSLPWISKTIISDQPFTYETIQNKLHRVLIDLISIVVDNKTFNLMDWKQITQKYDPLFHLFTSMESKRHLILCLNLLYHKLKKVERETVYSTNLQFKLVVQNTHNRRVKYSLVCPNKKINIYESSNKILPSLTPGGFSFSVEEGETLQLSLTIKDTLFFTQPSINVLLFDNTIWNPLNIYTVQIKQSQTKVHDVTIECEEKCSQQWIYKFQSKIGSEYKINLQGSSEFKCLTNPQLGYLKKGNSANIKIQYSPLSMDINSAVLQITCPFSKQVFKIKGKTLHSTEIQYQKFIKVYKQQLHEEVWVIPWEKKIPSSVSSRNEKYNKYSIINYGKTIPQIMNKTAQYHKMKQQMKLTFQIKIQKLYRNMQAIFKVQNQYQTQSKIVRVVIDVMPKPIIVHAQIFTDLHKPVLQNLKIYPLAKLGEVVNIESSVIKNEEEVLTHKTKKNIQKYETTSKHNNPFTMVTKANTISLLNSNAQLAEYKEITIKYNPTQILEEDPLFCVSLNYTESLYDIRYIFRGKMDKLKQIKPLQSRLIKHECLPLKKYKGSITLVNNEEHAVKYEVKTNLMQITGKPQITISPNSTYDYHYEIYCLHLGNKEDKIIFSEKVPKNKTGILQQFTIKLKVANSNDHHNSNRISIKDEILKIINEKIQISSTIREQRTLSFTLANKSSKAISYEIKSNSPYLKTANTIIINPNSQESVDIVYVPLFQGRKTAVLQIYNPNQPQIKYDVEMNSQPHTQKLVESNQHIAQYVTFKLSIFNPTDKQVSFKIHKIMNKVLNQQENIELISFNKSTLKPSSTNIIEAYVICQQVQKYYEFDVCLATQGIGDFNYNLSFTYVLKQSMQMIPFHLQSNKQGQGQFQFLNPFRNDIIVSFQLENQWKDHICIDNKQLKAISKAHYEIKSLQKVSIPFSIIKAVNSELNISVVERSQKYTWIFPVHIYETHTMDVNPVYFRGNADQKVFVKIFPKVVTSISNIKLQFKSQEALNAQIQVAHQNTRLRTNYIDSKIQKHRFLRQNEIYEAQLQLRTKAAYIGEGHILLYQNQSSLKRSLELDSTKVLKEKSNTDLHRVEIIPFMAQLAQPKAQIINFIANVGEVSKVQLKLQNQKNKGKTFQVIKEDKVQEISSDQIILYNNKSKQFSAVLNKEQKALQITYHAKEYSGLKCARLQIKRKGETSHFELRGKFPNNKKK